MHCPILFRSCPSSPVGAEIRVPLNSLVLGVETLRQVDEQQRELQQPPDIMQPHARLPSGDGSQPSSAGGSPLDSPRTPTPAPASESPGLNSRGLPRDGSLAVREITEMLGETTAHMSKLLDDVLMLEKLELSKINLEKVPFRLKVRHCHCHCHCSAGGRPALAAMAWTVLARNQSSSS
jgi:signal transduction histidine kinase